MAALQIFLVAVAVFVILAIHEQITLKRKHQNLPGPKFVAPFIGQLVEMILEPYRFYDTLGRYGPLSWTSFFGRFVLFSSNGELTRYFLNTPAKFLPFLQMQAKQILGEDCFVFMQGDPHKIIRHQLVPLFTRRALSIYIPIQERIMKDHMKKWLLEFCKDNQPTQLEMRFRVRDMNIETSTTVFLGDYLTKQEKKNFEEIYWVMNEGFLGIPLPIPPLAMWKAIRAQRKLRGILKVCASKSRERMSNPQNEPNCLLDVFMASMLGRKDTESKESGEEGEGGNIKNSKQLDDDTVGSILVTFLFASQDASTSSLVWVMTLLGEHPEVLEKVRAEIHQLLNIPTENVRVNDLSDPTSQIDKFSIPADLVFKMDYTRQVALEIVRHRPPATMVPYEAAEDIPLKNLPGEVKEYTVPKGTIVLPSIWESRLEGFKDADKFDPERFSPERQEHLKNIKNFLPFGFGPHRCIGREYALNHLMLYIAHAALVLNWKRITNPDSDKIIFLPTIFPQDSVVEMTPRKW